MTTLLTAHLAGICAAVVLAVMLIMLIAAMSRINRLEQDKPEITDQPPEPLGDLVDIRRVMNLDEEKS